ncbi:MAG: asparagine synthase (glutamine-hydrolyzing), partial [Vicinamibacterales bacterium]
MCGICGVVARSAAGLEPPEALATAALQALHHRGPDAHGEYRDGRLWFGHTRLQILDLSDAGRQPMATTDGRFVICYNGEVYNFRELAAELSLSGLRSNSDTEVVLRAFEERGTAAWARLSGMFAFALYDRARQKVWLVRDRLGIKPLYYRIDERGLWFGSEIKAILAMQGGTPSCDLAAVHEWLYYGATLGGRTMFRGLQQLLPGHALELDLESFSIDVRAYWSLAEHVGLADAEATEVGQVISETRTLIEAAVKRQLVSDVPVGVFLSGGVDSTAIAAFASRHYAGRLATYSAGFEGQEAIDERPKAKRLAAHFGTDHQELFIRGGEVANLVEEMVRHHDQPFGDAANIPLYLMARQISGKTKVVLQGDGGDELFGGYRRYATLAWRSWMHPAAMLLAPLHRLAAPSA